MFLLDGKQLRPGRPFTGTDGTQYPANWLQLTTLEEKEAIGITEVADPLPVDGRFYFGRDADDNLIPRQFEDEEVTEWTNIVIETDGISGIASTSITYTRTGLQTQFKKEQDKTAYTLLAPNDWYITRNAETGAIIPVGITSFRTEVRSVCAERQDMIGATTSVPQLADLVTGVGTAVVGYTTTLLPEWPNLSDYT